MSHLRLSAKLGRWTPRSSRPGREGQLSAVINQGAGTEETLPSSNHCRPVETCKARQKARLPVGAARCALCMLMGRAAIHQQKLGAGNAVCLENE